MGEMRRLRLMLILAGIAALLSSCAKRVHEHDVAPPQSPFDYQYLRFLIDYHQHADRLVEPCSKKEGIREDLRNFCIQTDKQHEERVERMKTWLKSWYDREYPAGDPFPLWVGTLNGQEFEREFLKEYSEHHSEGVEHTAECAQKAQHAELRDLCQRMLPQQQKTEQQLKTWRCEWFHMCD